jgi:neutral ceramidase
MRTLVLLLSLAAALPAADFKAGVARVCITPRTPVWLAGFAARTHPSEGVLHDLWAKALALEDSKGNRAVIVTTDLIGLPHGISDVVAARVEKQYGLDRAALLLNSSHTHSGPLLRGNLELMFDLNAEDKRTIEEYSRKLTDDLVTVVGAALGKLEPADLSFGQGEAGFAANRRQPTPRGFEFGVNPAGPVDHSVPILKAAAPDGRLIAVLFGYACHNTTLTAEFYKISGDYAGFAQLAFEKAHPGATAMFMMLCGADQNANPRSKLELAEKYGQTLAAEVDRVLGGGMRRVRGPIRQTFQIAEPTFAIHTRETFERRLNDPRPVYVRHARYMLKTYDEGHPIRRVLYPVQVLRFGKDLSIVALGGEVVVDYALRLKREYPNENLIVAGYSNDVMCYIPSLRVLKEGGYEAGESMIYYGQPGPFNEDVEEVIFRAIHQALKRVGVRATQ